MEMGCRDSSPLSALSPFLFGAYLSRWDTMAVRSRVRSSPDQLAHLIQIGSLTWR